SGVLTSTFIATAVDAAEPLTEPVEVCGASEASTAEPVEGVGTATAVIPAGGHGSPPGVRGRPRRRDSPPDAASPIPEPVEGLGASTAGSVASLSRSTTRTESAAEVGAAVAVGEAAAGATGAAEVASAGGQGSPPGVRGRPRRNGAASDTSTGSATELDTSTDSAAE